MALNTNIAPYYNDFDEFKNYHQILFRPGYSVQARELTQIQSMLRNQIEKFGNHIFRQGSIVIPGNSSTERNVPYLKMDATYGGVSIVASEWVGKTIVGATNGVVAVVKYAVDATGTDPITFYVTYVSGGMTDDEPNGVNAFVAGEDIYLFENNTKLASIKTGTGSTGFGALANVNKGVYYVNGTFVTVDSQTTVISKYTNTPSCSVLLRIDETIVDFEDDQTLLDPAQGSFNFAAPGADRIKLTLTLTTLPLNAEITSDYVEIMRYVSGVLEFHARTPKYSELEKSLAQRTYDESGDYIVRGYDTSIREHKLVGNNLGITKSGSLDNYAIAVSPGKAYVTGFESERIAGTTLVAPKARTADHVKIKKYNIRPSYGRYIYVSNILVAPSMLERQQINLYNDNDPANGSASLLGTARVLAIDYHIGDPGTSEAIYKLYITDVKFNSVLVSMDDVGGIRYTGGSAYVVQVLNSPLSVGTHNIGNIVNYSSGLRTATVRYWDVSKGDLYVFRHSHTAQTPKVGDQIVNATTAATSVVQAKQSYFGTSQNSAIFELPVEYVKSIRNASNIYDHVYTVQKELTLVTNGSGTGTVSIASGVMQSPEVGTFIAVTDTGTVSPTLFSLNEAGNQLTITGGPISKTIKVFVTVDKTAVIPRTKTLQTFVSVKSALTTDTVITLDKPDGYRLVSVTHPTLGDITDRFYLDNGQTDFAYYLSSIVLRPGEFGVSGSLTITFQYFQHSDGDFFVYDSYALNDGYTDYVLVHTSLETGKVYNLKNCVDARPSVNSSNAFGADSIVGDMLINGERINTSVQYYVPRIDLLSLGKEGRLYLSRGIPAEVPKAPKVPKNTIGLESYYIPAYTDNIQEIVKTRMAVDRYTMSDIADLSDRVDRLEEFSTLTASEASVIDYDVLDSETGLTRFKTGYLVETFNTPFMNADATNRNFSVSFDPGMMVAGTEEFDVPVTMMTAQSSQYQITNGYITVPYTERILAQQPLSSRITNINPFLSIKWDGVLTVTPNRDSWVHVVDRPEIVNVRNEVTTINRTIQGPGGPVIAETRTLSVSGTNMQPTSSTTIIRVAPTTPVTTPAPVIPIPAPRRGGKIICTKLYELGLLPKDIYEADQKFGAMMYEQYPTLMTGYINWASIVVDWMSGTGKVYGLIPKSLGQKWAIKWAEDIATPWAEHMAFRMGILDKDNETGRRLMKVGGAISTIVGKFNMCKEQNFFNSIGLIFIFALLKLVVKFGSK